MKNINLSIILILTILFSSGYSYAQKEAVKHMSELSESFEGLDKDTWKYLKALTQAKNGRKIDKTRVNLIKQHQTAKNKALKVKKSALRDGAIEYLNLSMTVLKEDFDKILDMKDIAEQSYDLMEAYMLAKEKAADKLHDAFNKYKEVEKAYAEANNINLVENEGDKLSQKIDKANDALGYYNELFLIFFKPYKQEAYALDALNREDISSVEQNANSLGSLSEEALDKLKEVKSYKGYTGLKTTAIKFIKFYQEESESDFPVIVDFYLKKEAYDKAKAHIESMNEKKRTQADIDKYNTAADEFNKAVNEYNTKINEMNNTRNQLFNEWTNAINHFFDNYAK